ncbi:MAG TPA: YncE family protein [Rhabdochlamydiaceae bacterium]|nr:YncE family protein [Rhabdochlamydiaceae bacterium]
MINRSRAFAVGLLVLWSTFSFADKPNTVVATIPVGNSPAGIAVTPNNLFAYVANNNNAGIPGGDTVSVLNLRNNTVEQTISDSSFAEPYTVTINAAGTKAYVTNSGSTTVTILDLTTNTVTGTIGGFDGPTGLVTTPDGTKAYVINYGGPIVGSGNGTTVSVVDLNTNVIVGTATVGLAPAALAITPDGAYVYVVSYVDGNPGTGTISIIRTSDNSVQLNAITGFSGPFAIAITPNGKYAYVTNFGSNNFSPVGTTVSVVDISTNTIAATIPVGIQPAGIAITPAGFYAYVSNYDTLYNGPNFTDLTAYQGTVNIIDIHTNKVISPVINVGLSPADIAISPNGQFAYVSNYTSNTVSVIALPFGLYDLNRLTPIYYQQLDETINKLKQAGLL